MNIRIYQPEDKQEGVNLWIAFGLVVPHNNPVRDIERKIADSPAWLLVGEKSGRIIASCMVGCDGHRGWINYLAVAPSERMNGYARAMMNEAENILRPAGCPKINLQVRGTNAAVIDFYHAIGFKTDDVVSLGKRLEPDEPYLQSDHHN